jgi:hypothetical protein
MCACRVGIIETARVGERREPIHTKHVACVLGTKKKTQKFDDYSTSGVLSASSLGT